MTYYLYTINITGEWILVEPTCSEIYEVFFGGLNNGTN